MSLRKIEAAPCWPITIDEARRHLAIDSSTRDEDALISMLIQSASNDAEMKTGRIFVKSKWVWEPGEVAIGEKLEFPTCPVIEAKVFDNDEILDEGQSPTDISDSVCKIIYPSPEPQGTPMLGWLLPEAGFPKNSRIELIVGYDYKEIEKVVEEKDAPVLITEDTRFTGTKIHLTFNRSVKGSATPENFTLLKNGDPLNVSDCLFEKGGVTLVTDGIENGDEITFSFISGYIRDQFNNFVEPIFDARLPSVQVGTEEDFIIAEPGLTETIYESLCPAPVKQWILVRVGTLYSQRSEIALRAGKSNDALFPDGFINNLLNPYRIRFN